MTLQAGMRWKTSLKNRRARYCVRSAQNRTRPQFVVAIAARSQPNRLEVHGRSTAP